MADTIADEVSAWLERTSSDAAAALLDSVYSPEVVQPPTPALLAYYQSPRFTALLWLPDGSPNVAGRNSVKAQVGEDQFNAIAQALVKAARAGAEQDAPPLEEGY